MPPKAATTAAAAPKAKAAPSDHASYQDMIIDAIINLKERNGSSRIQLKKYLKANNKINAGDSMFDSLFNRALKNGVAKEVFIMPKGSSGTVKLAPKAKKAPAEKAPKKATEKKAAVKKTAVKKTTATKEKKPVDATATKEKKVAPKKAVAKPKAAAKPKEKKATVTKAKKPTTPKDAPAVVEKDTVLKKTASGRVTKTKTDAPKKAAVKKTATKKAAPKKAAATA
ncbi:uncharacterized protein EAE98_000156 [Botrytis deweyae]|uniref:Histone H1 n=1 Tax=Botrytis deweyae TaxID=2478750 RepID=A0ABQ7J1W2_9HELO|nr:uncharacterized protein EAE98_000156 [Botrytis deweyae]KAF7940029.1 hypothetical protein EAE98_000156 [Botrytis deweyae]